MLALALRSSPGSLAWALSFAVAVAALVQPVVAAREYNMRWAGFDFDLDFAGAAAVAVVVVVVEERNIGTSDWLRPSGNSQLAAPSVAVVAT